MLALIPFLIGILGVEGAILTRPYLCCSIDFVVKVWQNLVGDNRGQRRMINDKCAAAHILHPTIGANLREHRLENGAEVRGAVLLEGHLERISCVGTLEEHRQLQ